MDWTFIDLFSFELAELVDSELDRDEFCEAVYALYLVNVCDYDTHVVRVNDLFKQ